MLTIQFYYRASARGEAHEGRLTIRLIHKRKIATISTSMKIFKNEWDHLHQQVVYKRAGMERKNYLNKVSLKIREIRKELTQIIAGLEEQGLLCLTTVARMYRRKDTKHTWLSLLKVLSLELSRQEQFRTAQAYGCSVRRLLSFTGKPDLALTEVDALLIRRFEKQLMEEKKSLNTISFYMRNLRAMLSKAVKKGWIDTPREPLFTGVFTGVKTTRKRALVKEELVRLNHLFEDPSSLLPKAERDALGLFLFSFHARGMSFVDLAHLRKEDIRQDRLCYIRRKTGKSMEVELTKELKKLLHYFQSGTKGSPYLLPIIKQPVQKGMEAYYGALRLQNKRLKRFHIHAGKALSTHMARHSWATIAKGENIPIRVISECLGHSSEKTTQIYLASFERSVLDEANRKVIRALQKAG